MNRPSGWAAGLAHTLDALANPVRMEILQQLQQPRALSDVHVKAVKGRDAGKPMARQTVKEHLDQLVQAGFVVARRTTRAGRASTAYTLNQQGLYALTESLRDLALLRPSEEMGGPTIDHSRGKADKRMTGACLIVVKGLQEGVSYPLSAMRGHSGQWVVGRQRTCHVPLDFDPYVSAEHARVVAANGSFSVEDLAQNRNGTALNFTGLSRGGSAPLNHGDVVGVGRTLLLFRSS